MFTSGENSTNTTSSSSGDSNRCCYVCGLEDTDDDPSFVGPMMLECFGCRRAFHTGCHVPEPEVISKSWQCTFCLKCQPLVEKSRKFGQREKLLCAKLLMICSGEEEDSMDTESLRQIANSLSSNQIDSIEEFLQQMFRVFPVDSVFYRGKSGKSMRSIFVISLHEFLPAYKDWLQERNRQRFEHQSIRRPESAAIVAAEENEPAMPISNGIGELLDEQTVVLQQHSQPAIALPKIGTMSSAASHQGEPSPRIILRLPRRLFSNVKRNPLVNSNNINNSSSSSCIDSSGQQTTAAAAERQQSAIVVSNSRNEEDRWEDYCFVCSEGCDEQTGLLGCCSACPRVFHARCHVPSISGLMEDLPEDWRCSLCLPSNNPVALMENLSQTQSIGKQEQQACTKIYLSCFDEPEKWNYVQPFLFPVHLDCADYYRLIRRPICLSTIGQKLSTGEYRSVREFASDMNQLFKNCSFFNPPSSVIVKSCKRLYSLYVNAFLEELPAYEKHVWFYRTLHNRQSISQQQAIGFEDVEDHASETIGL